MMDRMGLLRLALALACFLPLGGCGSDDYGTKCSMDSDCKTGVHCWCEPAQRGEVSGEWSGECPQETGTCLSPQDFAAAHDRVAAE